ncbi:MAG: protein of unassigned function [Hyphomicrobiales bacterium]|nr:protein of unassigned function [Hyphomicrobiales bacterium]
MMFRFDNSYVRLGESFHSRVLPTPVAAPRLLKLNRALALDLGLDPDALSSPEGVEVLAGNRLPAQSEPIAAAYSGHQFGHFNPNMGDGRAILLGEIVAPSGARFDIQLKGSGPTPYARRGDGRAALGPVLREYIVAEAMYALGVPTTRSLAVVATGEPVYRETALPGGVLTRVAASHIRVGTFQYFASRGDMEGLRALADHVIARHYPDLAGAADPYAALLEGVVERQAKLIAQWLCIGFIHGVMNTDNMTVSGETIDYGPCAFMEAYDPGAVFSSIDRQSRYAYANQPSIAQWNLARLAECLVPLFVDEAASVERANTALATFRTHFQTAYIDGLRAKLGLREAREEDGALALDLFERMVANKVDFTLLFRRLCNAAQTTDADAQVAELFEDPSAFAGFAEKWRARLASEGGDGGERARAMRRVNPAFIPRNHRVEAAIEAAVMRDDLSVFEKLVAVLAHPYDDQPEHADYMAPAQPEERVTKTFCGT